MLSNGIMCVYVIMSVFAAVINNLLIQILQQDSLWLLGDVFGAFFVFLICWIVHTGPVIYWRPVQGVPRPPLANWQLGLAPAIPWPLTGKGVKVKDGWIVHTYY